MAAKFVVAHRVDPNNVGDMASNPLQYFLGRDEYEVVDVANISETVYNSNLPMIVGGGGLIGNNFIGDFWADLLESSDRNQLERMFQNSWQLSSANNRVVYEKFNEDFHRIVADALNKIPKITAPRFIWGAGHNGEGDMEFHQIKWPRPFARYKSVGIRDYHQGSKFDWVPCASCMHPALSRKYAIKNDVIWFEHKKQLIKDFGGDPIPRFINSGNNIEQTIELLGSANIILTNSYHGVYWGTLLKKKVLLVGGAWSSKFKWFKHKPVVVGRKDDWRDYVDQALVYDSALDECRNITENYWNLIKQQV